MERGNPADTEQLMTMMERQKEIYGWVPRQVAADGGYASKDNLAKAKEAGIEANISVLKRAFGLRRCNWSGWEGFQQYVWSSVVSYNLLVLARLKLKTA